MAVTILTTQQIKAWDQFTIRNEPVASIDLMERAARKCVDWIEGQQWEKRSIRIFCGKGNNGGDGLSIARQLFELDYTVSVYILEFGKAGSADFQLNLERLHDIGFTDIHFLQSRQNLPLISADDLLVDALFGSGLNQPLTGLAAQIAGYINDSGATVVSIDVPSGMYIDQTSKGNPMIEADYTLTFQCYKLALLMQENAPYFGEVVVLDIGLHPRFLASQTYEYYWVDDHLIRSLIQPRSAFSHKGNFGHALLIAGSYGKMGAAVLSAKACIHSGAGLLTCHLPKCGYSIMQTAVPEAMVVTDDSEEVVAQLPDGIEKYSSVGIGPGIGTASETQNLISFICRRYQRPLVIDADGLNCLSIQKSLLRQLPRLSVLTPHPKEFDRLFGEHDNDFDRLVTARQQARQLDLVIVLKSHHTATIRPDGTVFFNSTGNAGMAKGGSGDVLTGLLTSLLAQHYAPEHAAILSVYIHGLAGDLAAATLSQQAMTATDIVTFLSQAFLSLK